MKRKRMEKIAITVTASAALKEVGTTIVISPTAKILETLRKI